VAPKICLSMIVRNEAHVIERCLASVKPFVDAWVVCDTGSTDGTQDLVRRVMAGKPGLVVERPWVDFAHNRNEALTLAQERGEYVFFIDADEWLVAREPLDPATLTGDAYYLTCEYAGLQYGRVALVRGALPWRWVGVLHEYLECDAPFVHATLSDPIIRIAHEGARSRDPDTYAKDAALLERALEREPTNSRYVFYLAQSYRDAGRLEQSRARYAERATMGGFEEEVFYARYQLGVIAERLGEDPATVSRAYLEAYASRPTRAEPLVALARYHRLRGEYALAMLYARPAAALPKPADVLFVDAATYDWQALDEVSVSAYYAGPHDEGLAATRALLASARLPEAMRARVEDNLRWYEGRR
jgi:glycosyltransferase involved in cell wall biosynthesis